MGNVKLIDCTLGLGGKLNRWEYGEDIIRRMCMLLSRSHIDVVELGLLRRQERGPRYAITSTTAMPTGLQRQEGQRYALLLDENYPALDELPERGERTIDIIRIEVTAEDPSRALDYSQKLTDKGYHIHILLTEAARYKEDELTVLLRRIKMIDPWACSIYDQSGVMDGAELAKIFEICDNLLPPKTVIGFHGCDNLGIVFDLAKKFCSTKTQRNLCIEASVAGMGKGALHLPIETIAEWMNTFLKTKYSLFEINYLRDFVEPYIAASKSARTKLLYNATAKNRCSYRYADYYYSELELDVTDLVELFSAIPRDKAFQFNKETANKALIAHRKKRLNMVIAVLAADCFAEIDTLLSVAGKDLLRYGIDLVIFDHGNTEAVHAVTEHFQIQGWNNLYYMKYTGKPGDTIDEKIMAAYQTLIDYDYIWVIGCGLIPTIPLFYENLIELIEAGTECITVDSSFRNSGQSVIKCYDQCLCYFEENGIRITLLGSLILKNIFVEKLLRQPFKEKMQDFWLPIAVLRQMFFESCQAALIISNTFLYDRTKGLPSLNQESDVIDKWGNRWRTAISELPAVYDPGKANALRIQMFDFYPFHMRSILSLREAGQFGFFVYQKNQSTLTQVSDTPAWKFYFAAFIPRWIAKLILKLDGWAEEQPCSRFSQKIKRLKDILIRLGA